MLETVMGKPPTWSFDCDVTQAASSQPLRPKLDSGVDDNIVVENQASEMEAMGYYNDGI